MQTDPYFNNFVICRRKISLKKSTRSFGVSCLDGSDAIFVIPHNIQDLIELVGT